MRYLDKRYPEDLIEARLRCDIVGTTAAIIAGLVASTAGGIASSAIGSGAAHSAATAQEQASEDATAESRRQFDITQANQAPWLQAGQVSLQQLMAGLAPGGNLSTPYSGTFEPPPAFQAPAPFATPSPFVAPTLEEAEKQPGYQFTRDAGEQAIARAAAASGGVFSTDTLGKATQFAENLATQNYGNVLAQDQGIYQTNLSNAQNIYQQNYSNAFNNSQDAYNKALETFQTQFNTYNTNQGNLYNRLAGTAGAGQTAANNLATVGQQTAATIGQNLIGAGNAKAAGDVGSANAIASGLGSVVNGTNNTINQLSLAQLMQLSNGSGISKFNYGSGTGAGGQYLDESV